MVQVSISTTMGPPTFSVGHSFAMMSAVLVSLVESTGAYKATSRLTIATPPPAYVLSRGIGWQKCSLGEQYKLVNGKPFVPVIDEQTLPKFLDAKDWIIH